MCNRSLLFAVFFAAFLTVIVPSSNAAGQTRKTTIALLDLTVSKDLPESLSGVLSNIIRQHLVQSQTFDILDRDNMESILKEQDFLLSENCSGTECVSKVGQLLGVEKMIFGSIGMLGKKILLALHMVDVQTGKIERIENAAHVGAVEDLDAVVATTTRKLLGEDIVANVQTSYTVYLTSIPEGAQIVIDQEIRGTTPTMLHFSSDDIIRVYIKAESYQDWFQEIKPRKDETVIVSATLLRSQDVVRSTHSVAKKQPPYKKPTVYVLAAAGFASPTGQWKKEVDPVPLMVQASLHYRTQPRFEAGVILKLNVFNLPDSVISFQQYKTQLTMITEMLEVQYRLLETTNSDLCAAMGAGMSQWKWSAKSGAGSASLHSKRNTSFVASWSLIFHYKEYYLMAGWNHCSTYFKPSNFVEMKFGVDFLGAVKRARRKAGS